MRLKKLETVSRAVGVEAKFRLGAPIIQRDHLERNHPLSAIFSLPPGEPQLNNLPT